MLFFIAGVRRPQLIPLRAFFRRVVSSLSTLCVKDLYVEPTELDCEGKHLFCHKCIYGVLSSEGCTNKCPVCNTKISNKRKSTILKTRCSQGPLWVLFATDGIVEYAIDHCVVRPGGRRACLPVAGIAYCASSHLFAIFSLKC